MIFVKRSILLTTVLACSVFCGTTITTYAESESTYYPTDFTETLTFSCLSDYAVNGDEYAFAEGTHVYVTSPNADGDITLKELDCGFEIIRLDYSDGVLYLGDTQNNAYVYPDVSIKTEYVFKTEPYIAIGNDYYNLKSGGKLVYSRFDGTYFEEDIQLGTGYHSLKAYGDEVFAVNDNVLYKIERSVATPLSFVYTDFESKFNEVNGISTKPVIDALKGEYVPTTVTVASSAYCTEIDLDDVSAQKFELGKTIKLNGARSALLLANSGNASVILMKDGTKERTFITATEFLSPSSSGTITEPEDGNNYFVISDANVYSAPYACEATKIGIIKRGTKLQVSGIYSVSFLNGKYYKVALNGDPETTCYVHENYVTNFPFSAEDDKETSIKDEFSYSDNVMNVVIVLAIISLVIIAIAYLTAVNTKKVDKKRDKTKITYSPDEE